MKNNYIEKNTRKKSVSAVAVVIATAALATAISSVVINEPYKKKDYTVGHWLKENNSKTCVDEGINYANSKNMQVDPAIDPYVLAKDIDELEKALESSNKLHSLKLDSNITESLASTEYQTLSIDDIEQLIDLCVDGELNESQKALLWYNEGIINMYLHQNAKKIITKYGDILVKCKVIDVTHDEQLENAKDWNYKNLEDIDIIYDDSKQGLNATNVSLAANDEDSFQLIDNIYTFSKDVYSWKNNNKFTFTKNSIGMDNYSYEFNTEVWKSLEALKDVLNTKFRIEKDISGISYIKKKGNIVE